MTRRWRSYSEADKALMWDRWQRGDSLATIARLFDREHSSIEGIIRATGGYSTAPEKALETGSDARGTGGDLPRSGRRSLNTVDRDIPESSTFYHLPRDQPQRR
jgi:hypothetical protein